MLELILFGLLGSVMGFVNAISGGAGTFAVPTMLAFGIPPVNALALNRVSDLGMNIGAFGGFKKSKSADWKLAGVLLFPMLAGAYIGANAILSIPEDWVRVIIIVGVCVALGFILKPVKIKDSVRRSHFSMVGLFVFLLIGIWDGGLAMAGGTFAALALVHLFGKTFLQARSTHVIFSTPETVFTATLLSLGSTVSWEIFLTIFLSSILGAWIGAHTAVKHGDGFIRKMMAVVAVLMIGKIIFDLLG